jgi:ribosomal protein S18 acetylase RimI-like enzyme
MSEISKKEMQCVPRMAWLVRGALRVCYRVFDAVPGCRFRYWFVFLREIRPGESLGSAEQPVEAGKDQAETLLRINPELTPAEVARRFDAGNRCLLWFDAGEPACFYWFYVNSPARTGGPADTGGADAALLVSSIARTSLRLVLRPGDAYIWDGYVAPIHRGRGIFTRAVRDLLAHLAARGVRRVYTIIDHSNVASMKSHVAGGFALTSRVLHLRIFGKDMLFESRRAPSY